MLVFPQALVVLQGSSIAFAVTRDTAKGDNASAVVTRGSTCEGQALILMRKDTEIKSLRARLDRESQEHERALLKQKQHFRAQRQANANKP